MLRNRRASKTPCVEASRRRGFQSRQASKLRSVKESSCGGVEAAKPRSNAAAKRQGVEASKPRSREATKRRGVEAWRREGVEAAKPRKRRGVEAWRRAGVEASRRGGVEGPFPEPMSPYPLQEEPSESAATVQVIPNSIVGSLCSWNLDNLRIMRGSEIGDT